MGTYIKTLSIILSWLGRVFWAAISSTSSPHLRTNKMFTCRCEGAFEYVYSKLEEEWQRKIKLSWEGTKNRGAAGVSEGDKQLDDGIIFVHDDCWQFCQNVGMHLGYFWSLSELNKLIEECTQNCAGVGVKMDDIRKTNSAP